MKNFSPQIFLASLGAGGIAVMPFSFFNYTIEHGKGLIDISKMPYGDISLWQTVLYRFLEGGIIGFTIIHLILTFVFVKGLISFLKTSDYQSFIENPLSNYTILTPFISLLMTMNVFIGPVRYLIPSFAENLQLFMLPALIVWGVIWALLLRMEIKLLKISFEKEFDVNKVSFGWLFHPLALGMATVTGAGIAALGQDPVVANIAAFMAMISGTMGIFLFVVKLVTIFKSHFAADILPEKQYFPGFLVVVPIVTLYAISFFRFGHFLEKQHGAEMGSYFLIVMLVAFAFETWYLVFGFSLLKDYLKKYFFKVSHVTQWGFVCPLVAYAVLGSFFYSVFVQSSLLYGIVIADMIFVMALFLVISAKHAKCAGILERGKIECA